MSTPTNSSPWGELETVDPLDVTTWRIAEDHLPGGRRVLTSFCTVRFAPAWSMHGEPHHFETMVYDGDRDTDCHTYATEQQARDGHAVVLARLRSLVELATGVRS